MKIQDYGLIAHYSKYPQKNELAGKEFTYREAWPNPLTRKDELMSIAINYMGIDIGTLSPKGYAYDGSNPKIEFNYYFPVFAEDAQALTDRQTIALRMISRNADLRTIIFPVLIVESGTVAQHPQSDFQKTLSESLLLALNEPGLIPPQEPLFKKLKSFFSWH